MGIEITLPEVKIDPEEIKSRNRRTLKEDFEKGGILSEVLIFTYLNQPISTTDLSNKLSLYYKREFNRAKVFRALDCLIRLGIIFRATSGYVLALPQSERKEIHNEIINEYQLFIGRQPKQFQNRYMDINYFWVANHGGTEYLEWCCKLCNFKYEEK